MLFRPELFALGKAYIARAGDTWNNIAMRFYGNPHLWWAVCSANGVADPTKEPEPGRKLFIPALEDVLGVLER